MKTTKEALHAFGACSASRGQRARDGRLQRILGNGSSALRVVCLSTALAALSAGLAGCATTDMKTAVSEAASEARKGPSTAPEKTLTNFSDALRCMDNLFITYGIRDVSVLVEELDDKTKRVSAGTKDMLISATSSMTGRSRAIRLVTFGMDSRSLDEWIRRSQSLAPFADVPLFAIRGSVSQFDQNLASREGDAGIAINDRLSVGVAKRASVSRMAIDLNMIYGANFSIVPGVTSQNSILLYNQGVGVDGDATIRKFGINFNMTIAKTEGQAQGLRNLVDLAAIEMYGRLTRVPYWGCLGTTADTPEVGKEVEDWFYAMEANGDLVPYIQYQLRNRGYYGGAVDAQQSPALASSIALYRAAMGGQPGRGQLDVDFFKRYLSADHVKVLAKSPPPAKVPGADSPPAAAALPAPSSAAASTASSTAVSTAMPSASAGAASAHPAERLRVSVESVTGELVFGRGQPVQLAVMANFQAHVHCYMRDDNRQFQRIFPNRFNRDTLMRAGEVLQLPGPMRFQIIASPRGIPETVSCFATNRDVLAQLPRNITGADFENLPVASFDDIRNAFREVTKDQFSEGVFHVRTY
jgi:hypothetical protein